MVLPKKTRHVPIGHLEGEVRLVDGHRTFVRLTIDGTVVYYGPQDVEALGVALSCAVDEKLRQGGA